MDAEEMDAAGGVRLRAHVRGGGRGADLPRAAPDAGEHEHLPRAADRRGGVAHAPRLRARGRGGRRAAPCALPLRLHVRRRAARLRRDGRRALLPDPRRAVRRARAASRLGGQLDVPELPRAARGGAARDGGRRLEARQGRAVRAALPPPRLLPQGRGRLRRRAHDGAGRVDVRRAGGRAAPARQGRGGRLVRDGRHLRADGDGRPRRAARDVAPARRRARRIPQGERLRPSPAGLDALPLAAAGPDRRPRVARALRDGRRDDVPLHGAGGRETAYPLGPRPLHLRLPRGRRVGRQGRENVLALGRVALRALEGPARQEMVQGQPERVEGQGLRRLRRHLRLRRPCPRGLPAAVVPLRAVVRARHRGGRGARHGRGPLACREPLPARLRDGVHEPRRPCARRRAAHRRADDADVQPRNALRLSLLRAADVPRRHARAAERPLVDDVRRRAHPPRDRDLRPQPPRRRQRALQLPHAGYAGGGGLHALLPRHVPRLRDVPHEPRLAARAPPGDARHAQRPRALRARGRPR